MKKALLTGILTATMAMPAHALTTEQVKTVNDFIKETGINSRSLSFRELLNKTSSKLPVDLERELRHFSELSPKAKIPVAKVSQIKEGKVDVVQIDFQTKNDHLVVQIRDHGDYAFVTGTQDGKKFEQKIGKFELRNAGALFAALTGGESYTKKVPTIQVLTADQVKLLSVKDKQKYVDRFRELMAAAEKAQMEIMKKPTKTSGFFWDLVANRAYAQQASGSCIVAGWVGEYQDNYCKPPREANKIDARTNQACVLCSPDIYGSGNDVPCLGAMNGHIASNATEICNKETESNRYAVFQGVQNAQQVSDRLRSLSGVLQTLREKCSEVDEGLNQGTKLYDQMDTCVKLRERVKDLESTQCAILLQNPTQFAGLRCNVEPYTPDPRPHNGARPVASSDECSGLPSSQRELSCSASQVQTIDCEDEGQALTKYYCECSDDQNGIKSNTVLNTGCEVKRPPVNVGSTTSKREKKERPWYSQPWVVPAAVIVLVLGATAWGIHQQNQINAANSYYYATPVATPVPPPQTQILAPTPLNVIRATPGVQ